ncbi:MAG: penicillin-binding protein 2 [Clostridia bacterium]|nr:penicillin-binding protein 2 [Clostridia bacterium]
MAKIMKRTYFILFILFMLFIGAFFRLFYLSVGSGYKETATTQATLTVKVDLPRGTIFDRNGEHLTNNKMKKMGVLIATPQTVTAVYKYFEKSRADEISNQLKKGKPITVELPYDFECDDAYIFLCYDEDEIKNTAIHLLGYLNSDGDAVCGIEKAYNNILHNQNHTSVVFQTDAVGAPLLGVRATVNDHSNIYKSGVTTTIDRNIQEICDSEISGVNGAVVVIKSGTGEILALSSSPSFSYNNISAALNSENSPFMNRALSQYNLGSIFKVCVAAAALESGVSNTKTYTCNGKVDCDGNVFMCHKKEGHGTLNMQTALSVSCNCYFINLAKDVGAQNVYNMAKNMGFDHTITLYNEYEVEGGTVTSIKKLSNLSALANFSIGQGDLLATPLTIALAYGAISSGGVYYPPILVTAQKDKNQNTKYYPAEKGERIMSGKTADVLMKMMYNTVEQGTGTGAKPNNVSAAGKTATAETGMKNKNGQKINQTWFVGATNINNPEYVIAVLVEDGISGSTSAAPIFKNIVDRIYK